jgi:uncharacterized protein YqjF (DUF2071 family)
MAQTLADQLFVHYRVSATSLQQLVPPRLEVEEHSGTGWLGVTPFAVSGARLRGTIPPPVVSRYFQLNVRTYVTSGGKAGIWFFSLDASSRLVVEAGRRLYRAPFFHAAISLAPRGGGILLECARNDGKAFSAAYRSAGPIDSAPPGSLEHFLTERYCLYAADRRRLYRADVHHPPWQLQAAEAEIELDTMPPRELELDDGPVLHYSSRQDVLLWPLESLFH